MPSNGKVKFNPDPPWGDRLIWNGSGWVRGEVPRGFPILTPRSKLTIFAWVAFFIADAAMIIFLINRIYGMLSKK